MKIWRWMVVVVLLLAAGVPFSIWLSQQIEIDKCLDAGGAWDYEHRNCQFEAPKQ
jgi:hypothetical protein